jgi:hypothetical protein
MFSLCLANSCVPVLGFGIGSYVVCFLFLLSCQGTQAIPSLLFPAAMSSRAGVRGFRWAWSWFLRQGRPVDLDHHRLRVFLVLCGTLVVVS